MRSFLAYWNRDAQNTLELAGRKASEKVEMKWWIEWHVVGRTPVWLGDRQACPCKDKQVWELPPQSRAAAFCHRLWARSLWEEKRGLWCTLRDWGQRCGTVPQALSTWAHTQGLRSPAALSARGRGLLFHWFLLLSLSTERGEEGVCVATKLKGNTLYFPLLLARITKGVVRSL